MLVLPITPTSEVFAFVGYEVEHQQRQNKRTKISPLIAFIFQSFNPY